MKTVSVFGLHKSNMYSKQIKGIALIIVLVLLSMLLCGCVQQSSLRQLNEDATLDPVEWGMTRSEVLEVLDLDDNYIEDGQHIRIENSLFFEQPVTVQYRFRPFQGTQDGMLLDLINVLFADDFEPESLMEEISSVLGEIETEGTMLSGNSYELEEKNRFWRSDESLEDVLDGERKQIAYQAIIDSWSDTREVDEEYAKWWLSNKYLFTAQFITVDRNSGPCLSLSGDGYLTLQTYFTEIDG